MDKSENGPLIEEKVWDRELIGVKVKELITKYDIAWDENTLVPSDDAIADRLNVAWLELAVDTSVCCLDYKRRRTWTGNELESILSAMADSITFGTGNDTAKIGPSTPKEDSLVVIYGSPIGIPVSEESFIPFHEAFAMKEMHDFLKGKQACEDYSLIIGGAATIPEITQELGADAQGNLAAGAFEIRKRLIQM